MPTHDEIRSAVIDKLAQSMRRDPTELAAELRQAGPELPCGSQRLVRAAIKVARELGFPLKPSRKIAPYFRSVDGVATLLHSLASSSGQSAA
jgi:hypothetical protein